MSRKIQTAAQAASGTTLGRNAAVRPTRTRNSSSARPTATHSRSGTAISTNSADRHSTSWKILSFASSTKFPNPMKRDSVNRSASYSDSDSEYSAGTMNSSSAPNAYGANISAT